jgi:hypothetical protein
MGTLKLVTKIIIPSPSEKWSVLASDFIKWHGCWYSAKEELLIESLYKTLII